MGKKWGAAIAAGLLCAASAVAAPRCTLGKIAELPVTMRGTQPMVEAEIAGKPVRLVADSGAFWSVLTPGTAAELRLSLDPAPFGFYMTGVGGQVNVSITKLKEFKLSGTAIPGLQFIVGGSEVGGAGVLGANVLGFRDVEYDLAHGVIRLMEHHDCDKANLAYWSDPRQVSVVPIEDAASVTRHVVGHVTVNGVRMRALFDTGASLSGLSVAAAARAGVHVTDPGVVAGDGTSGFGRRIVRSWIAPFKSFAIGDEEVRTTRLRIVDFGNDDLDMLVGADFFLSHHIYVAPTLRQLYFTYNGGPVFDLSHEPKVSAAAQPMPVAAAVETPAAELARRGAASAARGRLADARTDLDRAVALAPRDAGILLERARIRARAEDAAGARADADAALAIRPDDIDALLFHARLATEQKDFASARLDVDRLTGLAAPQADLRLALAGLYEALGDPAAAIPQLSLWIAAHPDDSRMASALNSRCWTRALAGRELTQALADCNASLRRVRNDPNVLDSRGLVEVRMRAYDAAIADYARSLAATPKRAWSLYGRGLARIGKGQREAGEADVAAAAVADAEVPTLARRYGIVPAG